MSKANYTLNVIGLNGRVVLTDGEKNHLGLNPDENEIERVCQTIRVGAAFARAQLKQMHDVLRAHGYVWQVDDPVQHTGCWTRQDREPVLTPLPYADATSYAFQMLSKTFIAN